MALPAYAVSMTEAFPPVTTVTTIFVEADGNVLAESESARAAGGEITVVYPNGERESTIFSSSDAPPPSI